MKALLITFAAIAVLASAASAQGLGGGRGSQSARSAGADSTNTLQAHPAGPTMSVDGRLDEPSWAEAQFADGFLQLEPDEGAAPLQRTQVQVLFGPNGVFIGAHMFDEEPGQIVRMLGRRDDLNQADWIIVSIDSYHDLRTAYVFGVNAAGVQYDALRSGGGGGTGGGGGGGGGGAGRNTGDPSWNAIWESASRVTPDGWVVEMRIPYSFLRFSRADIQQWGVHFSRQNPRTGEVSEWPFVPLTERTELVSRFAVLDGIRGIAPRRNIQITPYTVSRLNVTEDADNPGTGSSNHTMDVGGDIKVGLGSAFVLDATVNPDFGQVESDPAELNLTAFETVFQERRPFFVEGSQIFSFQAGPGSLLYSRRIGAAGPIIAATKLSGRTSSGLSAGLLAAATGEDFKPDQRFGAGRVRQQLGRFSQVGGIITLFDGDVAADKRQAMAAGVDWDLRSPANMYGVTGFAGATYRRLTGSTGDPEKGVAWMTRASKLQGTTTYSLLLDMFQDTFNPNDAGRITNSNFWTIVTNLSHQINRGRPFGDFQRASVGFSSTQRWSYKERLTQGINLGLSFNGTMQGFQRVTMTAGVDKPFGAYDLYQTRGLGPRAIPAVVRFSGSFTSDDRRPWNFGPRISFQSYTDGGKKYSAGLTGRWDVNSRLSLSGETSADFENGFIDWSSNESFRMGVNGWEVGKFARAPTALGATEFVPLAASPQTDALFAGLATYGTTGRYYLPVFGARDTRGLDTTLRSNFTFTRTLDFQFYGQLFLARARYQDFQLLRDKNDLVSFDAFNKQNEFTRSRFQFNSVVRWEYRPGSTVYLVWTQGRQGDARTDPLAPVGPSSLYDYPLSDQISTTFDDYPTNVFLIKVNYAFQN